MNRQLYGRLAASCTTCMYIANLDQARLNLGGHTGSVFIPLFGLGASIFRLLHTKLNHKNPITRSNSIGFIANSISIISYFYS